MKSSSIIALALALTLSFPAFASDLPNPSLTPGAINPEITQQNIQSKRGNHVPCNGYNLRLAILDSNVNNNTKFKET
jgi:hypothetical protein